MKVMSDFNFPILKVNINNKKVNDYLIKYSKEVEEQELKDNKKIRRSNKGGWHSDLHIINDNNKNIPELKIFSNKLCENINKYLTKILKIDCKIQYRMTSWFNKLTKKSYNSYHTHPGSELIFIYYVKTSKSKEGDLVLLNPIDRLLQMSKNNLFKSQLTIEPKNGDLLILPAFIAHYVTPIFEDCERLSISGNINIGK